MMTQEKSVLKPSRAVALAEQLCVYWMRGCGGVNNTSKNIRAVQSRLVSHPTAAI